jgi:hypothetical protein
MRSEKPSTGVKSGIDFFFFFLVVLGFELRASHLLPLEPLLQTLFPCALFSFLVSLSMHIVCVPHKD